MIIQYISKYRSTILKPQEAAILFLIVMVTQHLKSAVTTHGAASGRPPPHMASYVPPTVSPVFLACALYYGPTPKRADSTLSIGLT